LAVAPPSTRSSTSGRAASCCIASNSWALWETAIDLGARAENAPSSCQYANVPTIVPRAHASQCWLPRP
jgi:hypothetical protein